MTKKKKNNSTGFYIVLALLLVIVLVLVVLLLQGRKTPGPSGDSGHQSAAESSQPEESSRPDSSSEPDSEPDSELAGDSEPESRPEESEESKENSPEDAASLAARILPLLKARDLDALQPLISSKGLRLCPFGVPDSSNKTLKQKEVTNSWLLSSQEYLFGAYPGSGADIIMSASEYYEEFIWPADFCTEAALRSTEASVQSAFDALYPGASFVTYYVDDVFEWKELTLVFLSEEGENRLCALILRDERAD